MCLWPWYMTSDLENLYSFAHSHDEHLWQVSSNRNPLSLVAGNKKSYRVTKSGQNGRTTQEHTVSSPHAYDGRKHSNHNGDLPRWPMTWSLGLGSWDAGLGLDFHGLGLGFELYCGLVNNICMYISHIHYISSHTPWLLSSFLSPPPGELTMSSYNC